MIPEMKCEEKSMSSQTFRKMLETTEKLFNNGTYNQAHFRLSGGEPFLAFNNYKDIVVEYQRKYPGKMTFGILTNLTHFYDEIADWMEENNIGMQISLDDLISGKPLKNGKSSSETVLKNIQKVQSRNINFSFNTVLDIERTKDLTRLANYVSSFKNIEWGLNASYTENDPNKINEVIKIFDDCILQLVRRGFDIQNRLRFYNTTVGQGRGGCSAGINSFAIGTNLEVWPCQSLCDKFALGYFNENIKELLMKHPRNEYFRERRMRPECSDCPILGFCRGGCRATHHDDKVNDVVCQIRRNIIEKLASVYYYNNVQNYNHSKHCGNYDLKVGECLPNKNDYSWKQCSDDGTGWKWDCSNMKIENEGLDKIIDNFVSNNEEKTEVETPELDCDNK
jgi:radical SAM protein with 4Fe4S-binding SPASM domain